jgi:Flp pilus assembly protein TadG
VFDFGRAIYAYHTISNAARSGARVAIVDQQFARIRAAVMDATVGVNPDDISPPTMTTTCVTLKIGCEATVSVSYSFRPLTPVVGNIIGPLMITSTTEFPIERVYSSPP